MRARRAAALALAIALVGCKDESGGPVPAPSASASAGPVARSIFGEPAAGPAEVVAIDAAGAGQPFPHFWEHMFGSGRAILSLRESYRRDLRDMKQATDFELVRFHGIFHDEVGLYDEGADGKPIYDFSYVDQIYDGLLENNVKPFVELSFMPRKLASKPAQHTFFYKQYIAPPKSWAAWEDLVTSFVKHLVARYGVTEVAKWPFEVWNEPNLDFWAGAPKQATYFELYDRTARAIKAIDPKLRVGGPASAQAAWVDAFIAHCAQSGAPVDFVSTHVYANDTAKDVFGTDEAIGRDKMVCRAVKKVHDQVKASARPDLPLYWSEFNASYKNETEITDASFMAPWLADTVRQCDGLVDSMAFWTFSDVFEEQGVVKRPFYGGYGAIAAGGVRKPAFHAFRLLHRLGDKRLPASGGGAAGESVIATKRGDGSLAIVVWNLVIPPATGAPRRVKVQLTGLDGDRARAVAVSRVDDAHGSAAAAYEKMGRPDSPTAAQLAELRKTVETAPPEQGSTSAGAVEITLPPNGLALVEVAP